MALGVITGRWLLGVTVGCCAMALAENAAPRIEAGKHGQGIDRIPLRSIVDPASGALWMLYRDLDHPGGPGVLVREDRLISPESRRLIASPLIRAGDRVLVEEHTPVVDAVLEGVAVESAWLGMPIRVRLSIGHRVVQAQVVRAGITMLLPDAEARP